MGLGEIKSFRIAGHCQARHFGTAGIAQIKQPGRSCRRPRRRHHPGSTPSRRLATDRGDLDQQWCGRRRPAGRRTESPAGHLPAMVRANGLPYDERQSPGCRCRRPGPRRLRHPPAVLPARPGPAVVCDPGQVGRLQAGQVQSFTNHRWQFANMIARGQLGHDPAIGGVIGLGVTPGRPQCRRRAGRWLPPVSSHD